MSNVSLFKLITVTTPPCPMCGETGSVEVRDVEYYRWQIGALIQNAMPNTSVEKREQLISGMHSKCWDEMFADDCGGWGGDDCGCKDCTS